jgi:hypothetical protein
MRYENRRQTEEIDLARHIETARALFAEARVHPDNPFAHPQTNADFEHLRWFPYPDDIKIS